jgi:hypothetical protein
MKRFFSDMEDGQALIQVSIAMIVLLGFAALAIDVSFGYSQRRDMQNAADAGALAGAYHMCFVSSDENEVRDVAETYATDHNRADSADVDIAGAIITVTTHIAEPTFFANIFGSSELNVTAQAVSACGRANAACGLWPIAFKDTSWYAVEKSCGQKFILWNSEDAADCNTYDCVNIGPHVITDSLPLDGRAWVDFSAVLPDGEGDYCDQSGCGASEIEARLEGETKQGEECRSYAKLGECAAGGTGKGVAASAWSTAGDQAPRVITFPLYSEMGCTMENDSGDACGNLRYRLTSFGCVKIHGSYTLCTKDGKCNASNKVIVAEVACGPECASTCGTPTGELAGPGDVKAAGILK